MSKHLTRRRFMASVGVSAIGLGVTAKGLAAGSELEAKPEQGAIKHVTLLHFTDTHAQLETHAEYLPGATPEIQMMGGYARLKTAIDRERANCGGACFVVDGGDDFQGSGPAAWSQGEVILQPLKAMGLDVFVPGNWEPAYGPARFKETMAQLSCPVICYNFHDTETGKRLFEPSVLLERRGVRVAFIGMTDIGASKRQPPTEFRGMDTTRIEGLRDFLKDLRAREKPDLVVGLSHTGLSIARQMAREIPEFDVILSGHTHERTERAILEGNVVVVEPGCFGSFLGRLDIAIEPSGMVRHEFRLIPILASRYPEDAHLKAMIDRSLSPYRERMAKVAGKSETLLMRYDILETTADDFITDAVREAAHADIGFSNGFRFGVPIPAGEVTEADLWNLLPMDARMKVGWVTGKELKAYMENELELVYSHNPWRLNGGWGPRASGMAFVFNANAEHGKRIAALRVNGLDAEDDQIYSIASCEREGEALDIICRHPGTRDVRVLPMTLHEALENYFKAHPIIAPVRQGREKALDLPGMVFSQDAVLAGGDLNSAPTTPHGIPA